MPQFVADGVFFAELNEVLTRELAEDGYSGVEVRVTPMRTEIIIRATRTQNVLGKIYLSLSGCWKRLRRSSNVERRCHLLWYIFFISIMKKLILM